MELEEMEGAWRRMRPKKHWKDCVEDSLRARNIGPPKNNRQTALASTHHDARPLIGTSQKSEEEFSITPSCLKRDENVSIFHQNLVFRYQSCRPVCDSRLFNEIWQVRNHKRQPLEFVRTLMIRRMIICNASRIQHHQQKQAIVAANCLR